MNGLHNIEYVNRVIPYGTRGLGGGKQGCSCTSNMKTKKAGKSALGLLKI